MVVEAKFKVRLLIIGKQTQGISYINTRSACLKGFEVSIN